MKKRLLIGDDRKYVIARLENALGNIYEVDSALSPDEVISKAESTLPDVLVTDLQYTIGGVEGFQVLNTLREMVPLRILYTAAADNPVVKNLAGQCGANYLFHKRDFLKLTKFLEDLVA